MIMGFWSWLTGRDPKESDLYANYEKVGEVTDLLKQISTTQVESARSAIYEALNQLNSVNGLTTYVGSVEPGNFEGVFTGIGDTIANIGSSINEKAESIKKYEEAPWYEKLASTVTMGIFKVGEGLLSVVEDLGDGIVSLVGWTAGKLGAKGLQESASNFVKKEWSHDVFNFYYKSDFAKASAFTEDSAIAGGLKLVGKTVGYLYAGGVMSGAMGISSATNVGIGVLKASGSTWGATAAGFLGGLGSGTESGLNAGLDFDSAFGQGVKSGAIQGGLAFAGGKLGEKMNKSAAIKKAGGDSAKVEAIKGQKLSEFQGYSDAVTKAGEDFGTSLRNVGSKGLKTVKSAVSTGLRSEATKDAASTFKESLGGLKQNNPITQGKNVITSAAKTVRNGAQSLGTSVKTNGVVQTVKEGVKSGVKTVAKLPSAVKGAVTSVAAPGVAAVAAGSALNTFNAVPNTTNPPQRQQERTTPPTDPDDDTNRDYVFSDIYTEPIQDPAGNGGNGNGNGGNGGGSPANNLSTIATNPMPTPTTAPSTLSTVPTSPTPGPTTAPSTLSPIPTSPPPGPTTAPSTVSTIPTSPTPQPTAAPPTVSPAPTSPKPQPTGPSGPTGPTGPSGPQGGNGSQTHSGVGFDGTSVTGDSETGAGLASSLSDVLDDSSKTIDEILHGNKYGRIPTSSKPINVSGKSGTTSAIPIAAGLTTASAAGLAAKAYIDHKKANEEDEEEDYDDEIEDNNLALESYETMDTVGLDEEETTLSGDEEKQFINQDKQGDEYYHESESPYPILGEQELEEV